MGLRTSTSRLFLAAAFIFSVNPAAAEEASSSTPIEYEVAEGSVIRYHASHPLHGVEAESREISGTILYDPQNPLDTSTLVGAHIEAPWAGFDSGNRNRDSNVLQAVGARQYPNLYYAIDRIEGLGAKGDTAVAYVGTIVGRLYVNGVRREVRAPLKMEVLENGELAVATEFEVRMTDFEITPPSLLFVASRNDVRIEAALRLTPRAPQED
jgi:hypothetical protein